MRSAKFILLLLAVFLAAFWWGGDVPRMIETHMNKLFSANSPEPGANERVLRLLALKSAVNAKLPKQQYVKLENIPLTLQQAIIAVEDNRFYTHMGFDINAIVRAALVNLQTGDVVEGGSTITQQLVKNLFLSPDRTIARKLEELVLALDVEARYSKSQILEMYLNTIYFGSDAYGIGQASVIYFNKPPNKLTLAEAALLAGLPNAPSLYSPYIDPEAAKRRQAVVLAAMERHGYIDARTAQAAKQTLLKLAKEAKEL